MYISDQFFWMQNEGGRTKIELTGIAATEKSLRMMTGIASWTRYLLLFTVHFCCMEHDYFYRVWLFINLLLAPLCLPVNEHDTQAETELWELTQAGHSQPRANAVFCPNYCH